MIEWSAIIPLGAAAIVNILDAVRRFKCVKCCGAECKVDENEVVVAEQK